MKINSYKNLIVWQQAMQKSQRLILTLFFHCKGVFDRNRNANLYCPTFWLPF
ncbi:hypothetical protein BCL69_10602 [Nitrosomonas communis]|uniref:Uncharacterized protein n=1 Tax=Nitrosomonas communis TaxID=44574 RepID=A0A5D3Y9U9_9PROT|nr:hypothetical protein BCL69_10602 [Nitrosomonas communis]